MLYQKSFVKLNTKQTIAMARINPKAMLKGETPRLIDEWQKAPDIWNQVKDELDFNYEFGKYILTGSSIYYYPNHYPNHYPKTKELVVCLKCIFPL